MKANLIIQCIDTFGFVPAREKLSFFADGMPLSAVRKDGGFYAVSHSFVREFTLLIRSGAYRFCERAVDPERGLLRVNLIRKNPPPRGSPVWFEAEKGGRAVMEYGYFYLGASVEAGSTHLNVENPYRLCLEGRSFLLRDTRSGNQEFVVLEKTEDPMMTGYGLEKTVYAYHADFSVLLPAFDLYAGGRIPLEKPFAGSAAVRIFEENCGKNVRVTADG